MMLVKEVIAILESWAPSFYQESYDNCGLIVGNRDMLVTKVLISLDCTEAVVDEAINEGCNLIVAHHPIVFSGLKRLNGSNYVERTIIKAIKNDVAIYAIHTNLDNISTGVNQMIADKLGLRHTKILSPKRDLLKKIVTYIPENEFESVSGAIFEAGAGHIGNYSHCGFSVQGEGRFLGNEDSNPQIGKKNQLEKVSERRFETIFPSFLQGKIIQALKQSHPYEEVAYDIYSLDNVNPTIGSGMIGQLVKEMNLSEFLEEVKRQFGLKSIKYTPIDKSIKTIAVCGGSGSFLRIDAFKAGADVFLTSDMKYHEWFDAEGLISYIDIGHFESEQYTRELLLNYLRKNALSLQSPISKVNTNPVNYYI